MKTNCQQIDYQIFTAVAIALTILVTGAVKAQSIPQTVQSIPPSVINGLFTPTEAQRFFREGIRKFELEARALSNSEYDFNSNILQISPELFRQEKNPKYYNFRRDNYSQDYYQLGETPDRDL